MECSKNKLSEMHLSKKVLVLDVDVYQYQLQVQNGRVSGCCKMIFYIVFVLLQGNTIEKDEMF